MNKRVLIVANDLKTVYNFRIELVKRLIKEGCAVTVAISNDKNISLLTSSGCEVAQIPLSRFGTNPFAELKTYRAVKKLIKSFKPDAVLTYTAKPNIYGGFAARRLRVPYIANVTGLGANLQSVSAVGSIMLFLQRIALKRAVKVFFQNESNLEFFKSRKIVGENCGLLPGSGVNLEDNPLEPYPNNPVPKFVTIARIRRDKGYDELFSAVRIAKENGLSAEFHIVGWYEDDSYRAEVETMQKDFGVIFHGDLPHDEIHGLITGCDCLIHPSHHEGMSNVILEAAAAGRPCIVSDIPGCREGIEDGATGFCFKVKDREALYACIEKTAALPPSKRAEMGRLGREKAEREFDRGIIIEAYLSELRAL